MIRKVFVVTREQWKSRALKHKTIHDLVTKSGAITDITFNVEHKDLGKPDTYVDNEGKTRITEEWFEQNISLQAKAKGYTDAIFAFSEADGQKWGISSGHRGSTFRDGDFFGECWVKADEYSVRFYDDGPNRDMYTTVVPHELGHELTRQGLTDREMHDYDSRPDINNIEGFYTGLRFTNPKRVTLGRMANLLTLAVSYLTKLKGQERLQPRVERAAKAVEREMELLGHPVRTVEGYRSRERQDALYAQGRTAPGQVVTNAKGGESFHNYGVAVDFVFRREGYDAKEELWQTLGHIGRKHGFKWGGDWANPDKPHFEMPLAYSLKDFQEGKVDYSLYR